MYVLHKLPAVGEKRKIAFCQRKGNTGAFTGLQEYFLKAAQLLERRFVRADVTLHDLRPGGASRVFDPGAYRDRTAGGKAPGVRLHIRVFKSSV